VTITASDSCNKYIFTAHSSDTSINSYVWDFGDSHTGTGNPVTHIYTSPGTYSVTLITTNSSGYKDTIHYTSTSYNPITLKAYSDTAICYGSSAQLNATGASNYSWSPASGLSNTQIPNPVATPKVPTEYIVTGSDPSGCKGRDSVFVNVFPKPLLQVSSDGKEINCKNDSVQLFASGLAKYNWQPATYCSNATSSQPEVYPTTSTQFIVSGTDSNGCYASDSISVKADISTAFFMPNAFTPNNDGHNDEIYPIAYCDFVLDEFSVYNRWGQLIFTTHTYEKGWNGEFNNVPQPIDSYYYYVKGHNNLGNKIMFKGDITLVR
jgi:gliding motility-associated-like protein